MTLPAIYIYELSIFVYSNISKFESDNVDHRYPIHSHQLNYPIHKTTKYEKGPFYMGLRIFNKVPESIKTGSLEQFKINLKQVLIDLCPYTVEEFLNM